MTEVRDMVIECIDTLFIDNQTPSPQEVADAIVKGLGLEQEWAVAEYDLFGRLSHVSHNDYEFGSVYRFFNGLQERLEKEPVTTESSFGLVSRLFTHWSKV